MRFHVLGSIYDKSPLVPISHFHIDARTLTLADSNIYTKSHIITQQPPPTDPLTRTSRWASLTSSQKDTLSYAMWMCWTVGGRARCVCER